MKLKSHRFSCFALLRSEEFGDEGVEEGCKGVKANSTEVERQKHVHVPLGEELEHNVCIVHKVVKELFIRLRLCKNII